MDEVFRALGDPSRRILLDRLNERNGQTLSELCSGLDMARQSVTKHLAVLEAANLIATVRRGREKLHYLNAAPINDITERWIARYDRARIQALADLAHALEAQPMGETSFAYVTYIRTTPEQLWHALTHPSFTLRYWGIGMQSDWKVGSPILLQWGPGQEFRDIGQVVLESEPYRRLSYRWHTYQPEHAELFGWSEEQLAELLKEPLSKVSFDIEPFGGSVRLTLLHDGFVPGSEMLKGTRDGWPVILSNLKTLLETDDTLPLPDGPSAEAETLKVVRES
ncbi:MAG TPA: SRPBCC domain-containing protein [Actinomycetota bacterium]